MWKLIFAIPILMHGLAHLSGFLASWTPFDAGYSASPWLLSQGIQLQSVTGRVFGLLWLVAALGLVASALGIALQLQWWSSLLLASSLISLIVILPWWNTVPPGARVGAAFDILVIVILVSPLKLRLLELVQ
ncbi:MAG: hypothetical protein H3C34_22405 [Caldilineaceae bacterium]|nr:hypothetical protein [Caldilineaceae bacterium]